MVANLQEPLSSFRAMRAADLESVARIELSAYPFPWTYAIFRDCLSAGYECWVLERSAEVIAYGVLRCRRRSACTQHLRNAEQGRGHGRRVLMRLLDLARWHRVERAYLEVRPSNKTAIALYHDVGFNEIGRRPNYYPAARSREDALVMAMELLSPE
jgi:ribosomal-protein-alanine N-acetyltransferase